MLKKKKREEEEEEQDMEPETSVIFKTYRVAVDFIHVRFRHHLQMSDASDHCLTNILMITCCKLRNNVKYSMTVIHIQFIRKASTKLLRQHVKPEHSLLGQTAN